MYTLSVPLSELYVLYESVQRGIQNKDDVGYEDAEMLSTTLLNLLNKRVNVSGGIVEKALWSANLLNEAGKWTHPEGLSFDEFVTRLLPNLSFDKDYNLIQRKL